MVIDSLSLCLLTALVALDVRLLAQALSSGVLPFEQTIFVTALVAHPTLNTSMTSINRLSAARMTFIVYHLPQPPPMIQIHQPPLGLPPLGLLPQILL